MMFFFKLSAPQYALEILIKRRSQCSSGDLIDVREVASAYNKVKLIQTEIKDVFIDMLKINADDLRQRALMSSDDNVEMEEIVCSHCRSEQVSDGNDIIACDRENCFRAYHQQCLDPMLQCLPIDDDADWFCHECRTLSSCLDLINEKCETDVWNVNDLFPEELAGEYAYNSEDDEDYDDDENVSQKTGSNTKDDDSDDLSFEDEAECDDDDYDEEALIAKLRDGAHSELEIEGDFDLESGRRRLRESTIKMHVEGDGDYESDSSRSDSDFEDGKNDDIGEIDGNALFMKASKELEEEEVGSESSYINEHIIDSSLPMKVSRATRLSTTEFEEIEVGSDFEEPESDESLSINAGDSGSPSEDSLSSIDADDVIEELDDTGTAASEENIKLKSKCNQRNSENTRAEHQVFHYQSKTCKNDFSNLANNYEASAAELPSMKQKREAALNRDDYIPLSPFTHQSSEGHQQFTSSDFEGDRSNEHHNEAEQKKAQKIISVALRNYLKKDLPNSVLSPSQNINTSRPNTLRTKASTNIKATDRNLRSTTTSEVIDLTSDTDEEITPPSLLLTSQSLANSRSEGGILDLGHSE